MTVTLKPAACYPLRVKFRAGVLSSGEDWRKAKLEKVKLYEFLQPQILNIENILSKYTPCRKASINTVFKKKIQQIFYTE